MNWTLDALDEFGRRLGLQGWSLNEHGVAQAQLPNGTRFAVEAVGDEVLVYAACDASHVPPAQWLDALKRCHVRRRGAWPVQVGRRSTASGTDIVVLTRMAERGMTSQHLEQAVLGVLQWQDRWASGAAQ